MLKKNQRLSRREVEHVLTAGKRIRGALFSVTHTPASDTKFAIVVAKRIAKNAVLRNTIRRRAYDACGALRDRIPTAHVVLFIQPSATRATQAELKKELSAILG